MHDETPQSRRGGRPDDSTESAFEALGLSALFGDPTQENPVVDASAARQQTPASQAPAFSWLADDVEPERAAPRFAEPERHSPFDTRMPPTAPLAGLAPSAPAFADTISAHPPAPLFPWAAQPVEPLQQPEPPQPPHQQYEPAPHQEYEPTRSARYEPSASAYEPQPSAEPAQVPWTDAADHAGAPGRQADDLWTRPRWDEPQYPAESGAAIRTDYETVDVAPSGSLAGLARPAWMTDAASDDVAARDPEKPTELSWLSSDTAATAIASSAQAASFSWFAGHDDTQDATDGSTTAAPVAQHPFEPTPSSGAAFDAGSATSFGHDSTAFDSFPATGSDPLRTTTGSDPLRTTTFDAAPTTPFDAAPTTPFDRAVDDEMPSAAQLFPFAPTDARRQPTTPTAPTEAFGSGAASSFARDDVNPADFFAAAFGSEERPVTESVAPRADVARGARRARDIAGDNGRGVDGADGGSGAGSGRGGSGAGSGGSGSGSGRGGSDRGGSGRGRSGGGTGGGSGRGGAGGPFAGMLTWIRENPRTSVIAGIAAGVVVLGGLSFGIGAATSPAHALGAPASASASSTPSATPTVRPTPSAAPAASKIRTCSVAKYASDGGFGTLEAQVVNASTGEVLFDRNGSNPAPTASVLKMLTAAAAYSVLGPDYRVPTTVVKGSQPGQVVVIGGGDVTLSRLPSGQQSFYTNAPHLDDLANQVKQAWNADPSTAGQPITSLVVDTSLYSGPQWQPSWDEHEERVVEGSTPYMTSFMVDGDRSDPTAVESPRSTDPVGRAASDLADDLGGGISVSQGTAPAGAQQLGQVLSQPVSALAEEALTYSDNTIMEELARLVAIKTGAGNSFSAINAGTLKGLETYGISESGLYFADGSGLSPDNKVPASYLTQFMVKVLNRQGSLGSIYDGLPIAGKTGTLGPGYDRFDGSFSSAAVGHVNAKTGWIDTARTLAGVIHAKDGTNLTFAVYALNYGGDDAALSAIDNLTTAFYECGNNLSNN